MSKFATRILTLFLVFTFCLSGFTQVVQVNYSEEEIDDAMRDYEYIEQAVVERNDLNMAVPALTGAAGFILAYFYTMMSSVKTYNTYCKERILLKYLELYGENLNHLADNKLKLERRLDDLIGNLKKISPQRSPAQGLAAVSWTNRSPTLLKSLSSLKSIYEHLPRTISKSQIFIILTQQLQSPDATNLFLANKRISILMDQSFNLSSSRTNINFSILEQVTSKLDSFKNITSSSPDYAQALENYKAALEELRLSLSEDVIAKQIVFIRSEIVLLKANILKTIQDLLRKNNFLNQREIQALVNETIVQHQTSAWKIAHGQGTRLQNNGKQFYVEAEQAIKFVSPKFSPRGNWKKAAAIGIVAASAWLGYEIYNYYFSDPDEANQTAELFNVFLNGDAATRRAILRKHPEAIGYIQEIKGALI